MCHIIHFHGEIRKLLVRFQRAFLGGVFGVNCGISFSLFSIKTFFKYVFV